MKKHPKILLLLSMPACGNLHFHFLNHHKQGRIDMLMSLEYL